MQASIEKQRASVRRQAGATGPAQGFFTVPWIDTPAAAAPGPAPPADTPIEPICDPIPPDKLAPMIDLAARKESLDAALVKAVVQKESAGRPCAVSSKGAQGLMQLMPATAQEFGVKDAFDPAENLAAGAKLLKQLMVRYDGDVRKALGAYNAGAARVDKAGGVPDIPETLQYVADIVSASSFP